MPDALQIEAEASFTVSLAIYPREALFRTCYAFTGRSWMWLTASGDGDVVVNFRRKEPTEDLTALVGDFANALIDQAVRLDVDTETRGIRSALVAAALSEATHD